MKRLALALTLSLGALAALAPGAWAVDISVNDTGDDEANDGDCTLREAIVAANDDTGSGGGSPMVGECDAGSGSDMIIFDDPPFDGTITATISIASDLPAVSEELRVDGNNCAGATNGLPCVGLDVNGGDALVASDVVLDVRGLAITGADIGIRATSNGTVEAYRNWFGIKLDQSVEKNRIGIQAQGDAIIGGSGSDDGNVFAANNSGGSETGAGVFILGGDGAQIQGNYFGVAPDGTLAAGMENGVNIRIVDEGVPNPAENNTIGGPDPGTPGVCDGPCNLIANAIGDGVDLIGQGGATAPATGSVDVLGNFIGLGLDGSSDVGNGATGVASGSADVALGGPDTTARNHIAGNDTGVFTDDTGSLLAQNNFFGLNAAGTARVPASPADTDRTIAAASPDAEIFDNRFGGALVSLEGTGTSFQGNVVGVGTGGQDVGMDGYAVAISGDFVDFGGADPGEGNVVGFQTGEQFAAIGILGDTFGAQDTGIMGNFIGTNAAGASFPNEGAGIEIGIPAPTTSSGAVIGGCPDCANVISNSGADAVRIESDGSDENRITYNTGRNNGRLDVHGPTNDLFIELGTNGQGNGAAGPNAGIATPVIGNGLSSSAATTTKLNGTSSEPNGTVVDVYTTYTRFADVKAWIAEGEVQNGAWSVTYPSALPAGTCITAAQSDVGNNTSELAPPVAVSGNGGVCDRVAPRTRLTRVRKSFRGAGGKVTIRFRSNERGAKFQCSRQRSPFRKCRSPKSFRRLPDGECHRIRVRAVDQAGNRDKTPAKVRVCVPPDPS